MDFRLMRGFHSLCLVGCDDGMLRLGHDARPREFLSKAKLRHGRPDSQLLAIWFLTDRVLAKRIVDDVRKHGVDTHSWFKRGTKEIIGLVESCAKAGRVPIYTLSEALAERRSWQEEAEQELLGVHGGVAKMRHPWHINVDKQ